MTVKKKWQRSVDKNRALQRQRAAALKVQKGTVPLQASAQNHFQEIPAEVEEKSEGAASREVLSESAETGAKILSDSFVQKEDEKSDAFDPARPAVSEVTVQGMPAWCIRMTDCHSNAHNEIKENFIAFVEEVYKPCYALDLSQQAHTGPVVPPAFDIEDVAALSHRISSYLTFRTMQYKRQEDGMDGEQDGKPHQTRVHMWSELLLDICNCLFLDSIGQDILKISSSLPSFKSTHCMVQAFRSFYYNLQGEGPGLYLSVNLHICDLAETFDLPGQGESP
ncbi:hypothetical protein CBS101457_003564 [Exobasidium rhododendri]|nr:hypothetical protein CBS101457_003564 [Exobasidium rhododendri]